FIAFVVLRAATGCTTNGEPAPSDAAASAPETGVLLDGASEAGRRRPGRPHLRRPGGPLARRPRQPHARLVQSRRGKRPRRFPADAADRRDLGWMALVCMAAVELPGAAELHKAEEARQETSIDYDTLKKRLRNFAQTGKTLVFLDACHSGAVSPGARALPPDIDKVAADLAA
ncbi:hypothetical protein B4Q13_24715, partial [Lacticaseibacillus rhamnosus]